MLFKDIPLVKGEPNVYLTAYVADKIDGFTRDALLIIPGGAYRGVCSDREGEPIAHAFMPYGYNCFILHYSVEPNAVFPRPLIEASLAIKHIKDNAESYGLNPKRVFVTGFSAGGHLAAALGTLWHISEIYEATGMPYGYNRPTAMLPIYPVISSDPLIAHKRSIDNLTGTIDENDPKRKRYSLECCVDENTVPAFLVHTVADTVVNVENTLRFATALKRNGIRFEAHIYSDGPHGIATANAVTSNGNPDFDNPHNADWIRVAAEWMKTV
jgi:acetyl esterase/lipase